MKLSTLSAMIGLAFLSISLLFIQSSASYSADATGRGASTDQRPNGSASHGKVTIPAAALPPFDPARTQITESDSTLIVQLAAGDSRQDLHILPERLAERAGRDMASVRVIHADHGPLMTLRLEPSCAGKPAPEPSSSQANVPADRASTPHGGALRKPACGRFAA